MKSKVYGGAISTSDWPKWNDGHWIKPPHGQLPPLAIADSHYNNNQLFQSTRYRLILCSCRGRLASLGAIQDLPFDDLFACSHSSRYVGLSCLAACIMRAAGRILQQSRPNQEVMPLPGIYFFDGWRVRPCMDIPTDLPRTKDPPEHDTQLPAATSPTAEPPNTGQRSPRHTCHFFPSNASWLSIRGSWVTSYCVAVRNCAGRPGTELMALMSFASGCANWSVHTLPKTCDPLSRMPFTRWRPLLDVFSRSFAIASAAFEVFNDMWDSCV